MRHAARLPPPPVFDDRRLVQLIAFCKCKLSIKVLMSAFVVSVSRSHIYADICIFLMFAVNSLRVRRCWQSASLIAKYLRNALKIMPKSIQIHPKSVPNQPKWCQGEFRKRSCEQVGSTCFPPKFFGAFLEPLGRIGAAFCAQLGADGLPKSSFLGPSRTKI